MMIDRMEIDDAGANPMRLAQAITKQLGEEPCAVDVRKIASDIGIYEIREEPLSGLAGCLIVPADKSEGAIAVDGGMSEERKRFTIGHEIGHYVNPMHTVSSSDAFRCTRSDMWTDLATMGEKRARMEAEANQFAVELLMPSPWIRQFLKLRAGVDLEHVVDIAQMFRVSKEAAARRYLSFVSEPTAIVFSHGGRVRYIKKCDDFPRLAVWNGLPMPKECLSMIGGKDRGQVTEVTEAVGHHWLEKSRGISLYEQVMMQKNDYRITLLTVEFDEEFDDWKIPRFR